MVNVSVKSILLFLSVAALSLSGRAEDRFLYWMVTDSPEFETARIKIKNPIPGSDGYLTLVDINDPNDSKMWSTEVYSDLGDKTRSYGAPEYGYWAKISTDDVHKFEDFVFIVEVFNDGVDPIGRSEAVDYETLSGYVKSMENPQVGEEAFAVWNIQTVPEPTSGLLTLFGLAALALRRKKILCRI